MPARTAGRKGRPYRRARALVLADSDLCVICGHGGAETIQHVPARVHLIAMGLDPNDPQYMKPAHGTKGRDKNPCPTCGRLCNQEAGTGPTSPSMPTSRPW